MIKKQITKKNKIAIFLLIAGIILIAVGIYSSGYMSVFYKAIFICLECIGIG